MKKLTKEESLNVKGGGGVGIGAIIGLVVFGLLGLAAGIVDGYSRPLVCRK